MKIKENNKKNHLNQQGITLIALVVTIVVLLILAGVSLNAIFSENGIIKRAKDAQNKMDQATQNDLDSINELNNWIDGKINGTTGSGGTVEGKEGSLLAMYQKAQKDGCDNASGTCNDATHLHIGDYVDYKNPTSGTAEVTSAESGVYGNDSNGNATVNITQTYTLSTTKNNVKWRVLGIDSETGGLKLIAADPIERDANPALLTAVSADSEDNMLYLNGAESYVYGPTAMNKIGAMYLNSTYATKARSATMEDVNEVTGVTTPEEIKKVNFLLTELGFQQYGTSFSFENQYTPKLWLEIGKKADATKAITVDSDGEGTKGVTGYAYYVNSTNAKITSAKMTNTRAYDLLFKGANTKPYWLASRGVVADSELAVFGPAAVVIVAAGAGAGFDYFFYSTGYEYDNGLAVRPVVILKSDVMATDVAKIADPT